MVKEIYSQHLNIGHVIFNYALFKGNISKKQKPKSDCQIHYKKGHKADDF